jgi:hypothetical protein
MGLNIVVTFIQFFFAVVIGLYFWNLLRNQQGSRIAIERESKKEIEKLRRLRAISLTEPLSERTRPHAMTEIVGQEEGVRALRAALCGPNPQHVIIYGPPGVGKTAAARLVLEEARKNPLSPFKADAKFVEMDATTARFDERGIADPFVRQVHIPIQLAELATRPAPVLPSISTRTLWLAQVDTEAIAGCGRADHRRFRAPECRRTGLLRLTGDPPWPRGPDAAGPPPGRPRRRPIGSAPTPAAVPG